MVRFACLRQISVGVSLAMNRGLGGKAVDHESYLADMETTVWGVFIVAARAVVAVHVATRCRSVVCVAVGA